MKNRTVVGVDLEGKRILVGRVLNGKVEAHNSSYISNDKDKQIVLDEVTAVIDSVFNEEVIGIGVGAPSLVDIKEGIIHNVHAIPAFKKIPLKKILQDKYKVPVYINNDANCFVTGEKHFGKGQDFNNIVGLIISTGLGAGIIIEDKLLAGSNCSAGEFGEIPYLDHNFEYYSSEQFFINEYDKTCDQLLEMAMMKDAEALKIFSKFGSHLGNVIIAIMNTIDPELLVLGGSVSKAYKYFKNSMYKSMAKFEHKDAIIRLQIEVSKESKISVLGASALYYDAEMSHSLNVLSQKVQKTEEALEESEKKYYDLFNHLLDPVFIYDKKTHKFLDCNEAVVQRVYGYTLDELKKMTPYDLHPENEHKKVRKSINIKNPDFSFSYTQVTKSGKLMKVEILSDEIHYDGKDAWISIVRDVTDRRKIEKKAKRQAAQATTVNEVGKRLSSQLELKALFAEIVQIIYDTFDFYGIMLLLLDKKDKSLRLTSIAGGYKNVFPSTLSIKIDEGMIGKALRNKKTVVSGDVTKNKDYVMKAEEVTLSEASVPLVSGKEVIGVLDIQSNEYNAFDESDITALETLSTQIVAAIENARLYEKAQQEIKNRKKTQKQLLKSKHNLEGAKRETDDILNNVEEGIFLMDLSLNIGSQYSRSLKKILGIDDIGGRNFIDIFKGRTTDAVVDSIQEYFDLYFKASIDITMLEELCPLTDIELSFNTEDGGLSDSRFLAFSFKRVYKEKGAHSDTEIIASVFDITEQKILAKKLKESEEQTKAQLEMLLNILRVESSLLKEFMESTDEEISSMSSLLKKSTLESAVDSDKLPALLEDLYRSAHMIKGNASLLDLQLFVDKAHGCEDLIEEIKQKSKIGLADFVPLSKKMAELTNVYSEFNKLIEKMSSFQTNFRPKRSYENKLMITSVGKLIANIAKDMNKKVRFVYDNFDAETIPYEHRLLIKNVLIQLARNSIYHGIESEEERNALNKPATGKIEITSIIEDEYYCFSFRDDGRGIQLDKLRKKAKATKDAKFNDVDKWSKKKVSELIFLQGISTSDSVGANAGRGVGMDVIKNNIEKHDGKIEFDFKAGKYCNFIIKLPSSRKNKDQT